MTPSDGARQHAARGSRSARGLSQSVQWALLAPLVVLVLIGLIQSAIVLQARQAALDAAMAGAQAEALHLAPAGSGAAVAEDVATRAGLKRVRVHTHRSGTTAVVRVSCSADLFLDFGQGRITRTAAVPLERP